MALSNKINFQDMQSELLASAIMYFEDFIAVMHTNLSQAGFSSFDAFSIIEITIASIAQSTKLQDVISSLKETLKHSSNADTIIAKVSEFHQLEHTKDADQIMKLISYDGEYTKHSAELIIIFLHHLCANFVKFVHLEKSVLKSSDIEKTKFAKLLSIIFDKAFEKTLSELKH